MNVYNSVAGFNQDDADMTMINHSFIYGGNDESSTSSCIPIIRRQQAKPIGSPSNSVDKNEYVYVNQDPMRQIEQILNFYRQDLKQESTTQLDCNRQLITRLIDFLRPSYSSHANQMKELDLLYKEIFDLQEIRFAEQKEKNEQLSVQLRYLKKSIITEPIETNDRESLMTNIQRMNTMIDYDQWVEAEEETKQLHQLVKTQRDHIDQLVEILSSIDQQKLPNPPSEEQLNSVEIPNIDHAEEYSPTIPPPAPERLKCPLCETTFSKDDDSGYMEHISRCFNDEYGNT